MYMRGKDEHFKAQSLDTGYESFFRKEYIELAMCAIVLGRSQGRMLR